MTLFRQLMLLIIALFVLSLSGTLYLTFHNSRSYFIEQLENQTQDTATSLGLSLSSNVKDKAIMLSMVNSIFDRGYFSKIEIKSMQGKVIISRSQVKPKAIVPNWFINIVQFPTPKRSSLLMSGWQQLGKLTVISEPSLAYQDLWQMTTELFMWFFALTLSFLIFAYFSIKILFSPLTKIAAQARAICQNEFHVETKLPKTRELNIVTDAMNKTVLKLKSLFDNQADVIQTLRRRVYQDQLTGIGNRRYFEQKIHHLLTSEQDYNQGALILIELEGLNKFNKKHGFKKGDELIIDISNYINKNFADFNIQFQARISGSSFALVIFETEQQLLNEITQNALLNLQEIMHHFDGEITALAGIIIYHFGQSNSSLLSIVDNAIGQARQKGFFRSHLLLSQATNLVLTSSDWHKQIIYALANKTFKIYSQKVVNNDGNSFHQEVYSKFISQNNELVPAREFFPMAEKELLANQIDEYVLTNLLNKNSDVPYAINISATLLHSKSNLDSFFKILEKINSNIKFHFEISEHIMSATMEQTTWFIEKITKLGHKVGLDRVGSSLSALHYLSHFKISYLKIDGSFSYQISHNEDKQFFVRHIQIAARTIGIDVIATNVESKQDWQTLQELGITWGQGIYLNEVKELE